jgi:hypothetical protein
MSAGAAQDTKCPLRSRKVAEMRKAGRQEFGLSGAPDGGKEELP